MYLLIAREAAVFLLTTLNPCLAVPATGTIFARSASKFRPLAVGFNGQIRKSTPLALIQPRLSAPALWHPSRGHPCAARMQTQLNTLRLQSSIFLATSCWNQPGPLCPLMAVMSVAGHWPVPLHMRQPSTSNSQLPLTAPGSHTPPDAVIAFTCVYLLGSQST